MSAVTAAVVALVVVVAVPVAALAVVGARRLLHDPAGAAPATSGPDPGVVEVESMREALGELAALVHQLRRERAGQQGDLVARLEHATRSQEALAEVTGQLRATLASPTRRGSWGERTAEDILRRAGLVEGVSYVRQRALPTGARPDVTFLLPHGRYLHMDVKFPADNYLRSLDATSAAECDVACRRFLADVRDRVRELASRHYSEGQESLDHVLLFIPNEAIFAFVHEHAPELADQALEHRVLLCSPFTLFGVLSVIRQAVEAFQLEQRSDEILRCLSAFGAQWERFCGQLDKVDRHLQTLANSMAELSGPRRNQLQRQLDRIHHDEPPVELRAVGSGGAPSGSGAIQVPF